MSSSSVTAKINGSKRLTAKGERTRSAILDAAERQFSERGYDGVSLRQIMEEASVQMGQLLHYFPSKEEIFVGVIERRLPEVVTDYAEALAQLDRAAKFGEVDLRMVVRAVLSVSRFWLAGVDAGKHRYLKMLGLSTMIFSQSDFVTEHTLAFKPLNDLSMSWIASLFPDSPSERVSAAYHFLESSLVSLYVNIDSIFARTGRKRTARAVEAMYDDLETFIVGGVERLLTAP